MQRAQFAFPKGAIGVLKDIRCGIVDGLEDNGAVANQMALEYAQEIEIVVLVSSKSLVTYYGNIEDGLNVSLVVIQHDNGRIGDGHEDEGGENYPKELQKRRVGYLVCSGPGDISLVEIHELQLFRYDELRAEGGDQNILFVKV